MILNMTEDSIESSESEKSDDGQNRWLESMIQADTEPRITGKSKPPKKQARQLFPFQCSECNAKYKTEKGYTKHLREKHGLN